MDHRPGTSNTFGERSVIEVVGVFRPDAVRWVRLAYEVSSTPRSGVECLQPVQDCSLQRGDPSFLRGPRIKGPRQYTHNVVLHKLCGAESWQRFPAWAEPSWLTPLHQSLLVLELQSYVHAFWEVGRLRHASSHATL